MGEFFLPASEYLAQSIYKNRRDAIEQACFDAGIQAVNEGKIDYDFMKIVSNPRISHKTFQNQADNFWKSLDGKKSYIRAMPSL
jgi:hypothetical protein